MSTETDSREAPPRERREGRGDRRRQVVRVAAVGDFHCGEQDVGMYRAAFAKVNQEAEVLLLAGDLTRWGTPAEMRVAVGELADVTIPIVAVLGNHDYESDQVEEISCILRDRGVNLLDGDIFELNEQVGIAGVKGFIGGFGRRTLTSFGEPETKRLVTATQEEVKKLELALRRLAQPVRIVLLHYAPIVDTVLGEPEQIFAFLGTDRLAEPIDRFGAAVAFHGHAHTGSFRGATPGGVPVFNVSHVLLQQEGAGEMYFVYEIPLSPRGEPAAEREEAVVGQG
ncbi:MAG: metallophosphoesterase [Gemmatimonadota bacterium]|nr:metallophosphoesterase [Gemmatimonadota bacterium]MDQ3605125.1 metallophosphoesterase [Gemmatimonadota bacterium]